MWSVITCRRPETTERTPGGETTGRDRDRDRAGREGGREGSGGPGGSLITHREEHGVDIEGEFDEVVEAVGLPELRVGRHGGDGGCWAAGR